MQEAKNNRIKIIDIEKVDPFGKVQGEGEYRFRTVMFDGFVVGFQFLRGKYKKVGFVFQQGFDIKDVKSSMILGGETHAKPGEKYIEFDYTIVHNPEEVEIDVDEFDEYAGRIINCLIEEHQLREQMAQQIEEEVAAEDDESGRCDIEESDISEGVFTESPSVS